MNTPAHAIINLLILGRKDKPDHNLMIVLGSILPDLPMFIFYFYEKIRAVPERIIWTQSYYDSGWQLFIDLFNSFPLAIIGGLIAYYYSASKLISLFVSIFLHLVEDFPLHNHDAHRHFLPFSNWRFHSPISYWDSRHYGHIIGLLEAFTVVIACFILARRYTSLSARILIGIIVAVYIIYFGYAFFIWG
jgi:hypothetical protein